MNQHVARLARSSRVGLGLITVAVWLCVPIRAADVPPVRSLLPKVNAGAYADSANVGIRPHGADWSPYSLPGGFKLDIGIIGLWLKTNNVTLTDTSANSDALTISGLRASVFNKKLGDIFWFGTDLRAIQFWKTTENNGAELRTQFQWRKRLKGLEFNVQNRFGRLQLREGVESLNYVEPRMLERADIAVGARSDRRLVLTLQGRAIITDYLTGGLDYMDRSEFTGGVRAGWHPAQGISFGVALGGSDHAFRESVRNGFSTQYAGGWIAYRGIPGKRIFGFRINAADERVSVDNAIAYPGDTTRQDVLTGNALVELVLGDAAIVEAYGTSEIGASRETNFGNIIDYGLRWRWLMVKETRSWLVTEYGSTYNNQSVSGRFVRQWHLGADLYWVTSGGWAVQAGWRQIGNRSFISQRNYTEYQTRLGMRVTF